MSRIDYIAYLNPITGLQEMAPSISAIGRAASSGDADLLEMLCREHARQEAIRRLRYDVELQRQVLASNAERHGRSLRWL